MITQQSQSRIKALKVWWLVWLGLLLLALLWRAQNLDAFGLSNDEGAHLMWAGLAVDGYPLYSQTQAVQAPLFIEVVGWALRLGGPTIQAGRWVALIGFCLLAIALSWLAHKSGGVAAALAALALAALSPLLFTFSRLVMAEVPATALAVVSVALAVLYLNQQHRAWLIASGVALGLSFAVKALNPFVVAPVVLLVMMRRYRSGASLFRLDSYHWPALLADLLLWGAGLIGPVVALFFIYDPQAIYDQLVVFRSDLRAALPGSWAETAGQFAIFFQSHWGFWLLAFGGIISTVLLNEFIELNELTNSTNSINFINLQLIWLVWLIAGVMMLAWHTPLFPHHFIVLLPPLILLGAGFIGNLGRLWTTPARPLATGALALGLLLLGASAFNLPAIIEANRQTAAIVTGGREQQALELLAAVSQPDDFLMGDSQLLVFMVNRRTPPPLGDVALVAIKAGRQTSANMIELTRRYQAPAVVQWSLRLPWLPEYLQWVEANYLARRVWDNDHIIYFGRRIPPGEAVPNERAERLGDSLWLRGFELHPSALRPGDTLNLKVYWQTDAPLAHNYTVFTQLLNSSGALVAGKDSQPLGGHLPTGQWPAGEIVTDMLDLSLPDNLPPGQYKLITGMYLLETLERLPVPDSTGDYITLTTVEIK